jgi:hypothetical protein
MAENFKLQLSLKRIVGSEEPPEPVHFKVDGGRFDSEKTIKLNVDSKYSLEFNLKPALVVE